MTSFHLVAITTIILFLPNPIICARLIYDENENLLADGGEYYIIPVSGGGLTYDNPKCPLHIIQETNKTSPGVPVKISLLNKPRYGLIAQGQPLSLSFKVPSGSCKDKLGWKVTDGNSSIVTDDGTADYGFRIVELIRKVFLYSIVYYPGNPEYSFDFMDVGFSKEDGLLGVIEDDAKFLTVTFRPASNVKGLNSVARIIALPTSSVN